MYFLAHPGSEGIFSGHGLTTEAGRIDRLTGLLMVDRPQPADPAWLAEIEDAFGHYSLTPMTETGERGIACQMRIEPDSFQYLARGGVEWQLKPRWAIYVDARFEWVDDPVVMTAHGRDTLGQATPNGEIKIDYPISGTPFRIIRPGPGGPPIPRKYENSISNWFIETGELDYGGWSFSLGGRYTF